MPANPERPQSLVLRLFPLLHTNRYLMHPIWVLRDIGLSTRVTWPLSASLGKLNYTGSKSRSQGQIWSCGTHTAPEVELPMIRSFGPEMTLKYCALRKFKFCTPLSQFPYKSPTSTYMITGITYPENTKYIAWHNRRLSESDNTQK